MTETKKKNIWYIVALSICSLGIVALICLFIWAFPYKSKESESKENDTGLRVMKEERTHLQLDEQTDYSNLDWYIDNNNYVHVNNFNNVYFLDVIYNYYIEDTSTHYTTSISGSFYAGGMTRNLIYLNVGDYLSNNFIRIFFKSADTRYYGYSMDYYPNVLYGGTHLAGINQYYGSNSPSTPTYPPNNFKFTSSLTTLFQSAFENYIDSLETTFSYLGSSGEDSSTQTIDTGNKIVIAQNFNPNVWLSSTLYNNGSLASAGGDSVDIDLTGLKFECNNMIFDTIRIKRNKVDAQYISFDGSSIANFNDVSTYSDFYFVMSLLFRNSIDNTSVMVWRVNTSIIDGNTCFVLTESIWINDSYRTLIIVEDSETIQSVPAYSNMTTRQLLSVVASVNSNLLQQDAIYLIKESVNGISGILDMTILPGITIGLLMFIPLIVSVILFIVKLIKK